MIQKDDAPIRLRPLRVDDMDREHRFFKSLSVHTRQMRLMGSVRDLTPEQLRQACDIDENVAFAVAATAVDIHGEEQFVGVARFSPSNEAQYSDAGQAEFAVVVNDEWQRMGIARRLMRQVLYQARKLGYRGVQSETFSINEGMIGLARSLGMTVTRSREDPALCHLSLIFDDESQQAPADTPRVHDRTPVPAH